jgi:hypothetical protein
LLDFPGREEQARLDGWTPTALTRWRVARD